jgi:hypothetical protein
MSPLFGGKDQQKKEALEEWRQDRELQERITCLVAEGLQQLEHASLVRLQVEDQTSYGSGYWLTRRGRTAFERGEVEDILTAATG